MRRPECFGSGFNDIEEVCRGTCEYVEECSNSDGYSSTTVKRQNTGGKRMKIYDLLCILNAMPEDHDLYINGRVIEEVQLNMTRETVNLTLRGEVENTEWKKMK